MIVPPFDRHSGIARVGTRSTIRLAAGQQVGRFHRGASLYQLRLQADAIYFFASLRRWTLPCSTYFPRVNAPIISAVAESAGERKLRRADAITTAYFASHHGDFACDAVEMMIFSGAPLNASRDTPLTAKAVFVRVDGRR